MALTDEGHIRDTLRYLESVLYAYGCILQEMRPEDPRLVGKGATIWNDLATARGHIKAIRVKGDAAREARETQP